MHVSLLACQAPAVDCAAIFSQTAYLISRENAHPAAAVRRLRAVTRYVPRLSPFLCPYRTHLSSRPTVTQMPPLPAASPCPLARASPHSPTSGAAPPEASAILFGWPGRRAAAGDDRSVEFGVRSVRSACRQWTRYSGGRTRSVRRQQAVQPGETPSDGAEPETVFPAKV